MSGTSLLGEVAQISPSTRRLLISAFPESPDIEEARGAAVEELIAKPWDDGALRQAIRDCLGVSTRERV